MKKIAILTLSLLLLGTGLQVADARTAGRGCKSLDVNRDRRITAADALVVLRASVGLYPEHRGYDVNHDQKITAADSLAVLRAAVGLDDCE